MANNNLGTIRGTIEIDYDGAGIVRAVKDVDRLTSTGDKLSKMSNGVLSAFSKFARGAALVGAGVSSANNILGLLAGTMAVVAPLAAAGFAAAPGVIASYAAALGVAKVALMGMEDALGAVGEEQKKFDKATEGLSSNAKGFVVAIRNSLPALRSFKDSLQQAFFRGTDKLVGGVVNNIGKLKGEATGVASEMNGVVTSFLKFAGSADAFGKVNNILRGTKNFIAGIKDDLVPLGSAVLGLAAQFSMFGTQAGDSVGGLIQRLTAFIQNVNLAQIFADATPIVQSLSAFLGDVVSIAGQLFSIFNVDGASAASMLATLASTLATFLQSAQGQAALQALGQAMSDIAAAAGPVFLALLQALAPTIVALAPGVGTLATQISGVLVPAITALTPLLVSTAGFLSENMSWLGPLAGAILAAAAAYKAYTLAAAGVAAAQALINSAAAKSTIAWISNTAAVVANRVAQVASAAVTGGAAVAAWIAQTAAIIANRVAQLASLAAMAAIRAATIAWTAVQWLLNAALAANPIGLVVLAIVALVAGFVLLYKNSETFRNIVNAVWNSIKATALIVVQWFKDEALPILKNVWQGISVAVKVYIAIVKAYISAWIAFLKTAFNVIKTVVTTVWNFIKANTQAIWNGITGFIRGAINRVVATINNIRNVVNIVRNAFNQARNAVNERINSILSLVRSLPGKVSSALGNLGSLLFSKGKSLVQGFINGIQAMIGRATAAARNLVSAVTDFLPGSPAKKGPLAGRGYALLRARRMVADLAKGIETGSHLPGKAMLGAVTPVARVMSAPTSTGVSKPPASTHAEARTFGPYNLVVDGKVIASIAIDAVTGNPKAVAAAATEGRRQISWTRAGR